MKLNFPNFLVLIRMMLVPIIIILLILPGLVDSIKAIEFNDSLFSIYLTDIIAGILFLIASLTDYIDGWYARKYNKITVFGKLFDPLADKILINTTLIIFASRGIIPIIFVLIFIARDILVDGLRMMLASNNIILAADKWGKLKTIFQMIGITLLFFIHPSLISSNFFQMFIWSKWEYILLLIPLIIGLLFSIISGFNYYVGGFKSLKNNG